MPDVEMTKELEKSPYDQKAKGEKRVLANSIEIDRNTDPLSNPGTTVIENPEIWKNKWDVK